MLSISASIRKASAPTPSWRLSWLKLLMVTNEAEFKILEASYGKDVDSLRTADVSPRSMPQKFPLVTGLSAAISEEKRLPFEG